MYGKIISADLRGIEGYLVSVEADISDGMPLFLMVGYLASEVREAGDRVRTALRNCGVFFPAKRITVNLAPAGVRKAGSRFDLPIAAALLAALGRLDSRKLEDVMLAGELRLNGEVHGIPGVLSMVEAARAAGCSCCVIPADNVREASMIPEMRIIGIRHLRELLQELPQPEAPRQESLLKSPAYPMDFSQVNGQESVKRAAAVAAAGMHSFLMIGPPGGGKTMIARRIPTILPPLGQEESLEISKIYSIAGLLSPKEPRIQERPFRAPHHTVSRAALIGGGSIPLPGEISLSGHGVLFLDELTEYKRDVLEVLRQPMEEKRIRISRNFGTYEYPAKFMLVAAMNPCRCGFYPDMNRCTCSPGDLERYLGRLSRPFLDRIDICAEAPQLTYRELTAKTENTPSAQIRAQVETAHRIQQERYRGTDFSFNSDLDPGGLERFCPLGKPEKDLLENVFTKMKLSVRAYHRIIKTARTIADLEGAEKISCGHLMEAVCYRPPEQKQGGR